MEALDYISPRELLDIESPLRALITSLNVILRVIGCDGTYLLSEGRALAQIGRVPGDLVGESIYDVQAGRPDILADITRALNGETFSTTVEIKGIIWESRYSPLYVGAHLLGTVYVAMDITARVRAEEALRASEAQLKYQATHDPLTGLLNRAHFLECLEGALASIEQGEPGGQGGKWGTQIALLFLDLDGFKHVNDRLGHHAGDVVLQTVAQRLQGCVRQREGWRARDLIGRFGGDEFIAVLAEIPSAAVADQIAARIAAQIALPIPLGDDEAQIAASIGIVLTRTAHTDARTLLRTADTAMYTAKRTGKGRNRVVTL